MSDKSESDVRILQKPIDPKFIPEAGGIGTFYFKKLKEHEDKIAQIDSETGKTEIYKEVLFRSVCVAQGMIARGIKSDDILSLCSYNHMDTCLPFLAATFLANRMSSLDPSLSIDDMIYMMNITKPRMIFTVPESVEAIETALNEINLNSEIVVFGETTKHIPFKEFLVIRGNESSFKPRNVKDLFETASIFFSSGTTGLPKGTCLNHYGLLYASNCFGRYFDLTVNLHFSTPYWISYIFLYSTTLSCGGCRVISKSFDGQNVLGIIEKFQVTNLFLPPAFTHCITSNPDCHKYELSSLKTIITGGGRVTEEQILAIQKLFLKAFVLQLYGMTEICTMCTGFDPKTDANFIISKRSSCGKLESGFTCKIVDPETNQVLGPNQPGELLLKSKCIMNGYYNKPEETKQCLDDDGFLHTGDILYYDEDECFYYVDRIKEMFKYRTWHIIPAELERILLTHPAVQEAIVIGYPHKEDGDHPMAAIVLKKGVNISEDEIIKFFNDKVSDRKKLRAGVKFVTNIPKTTTGKYSRRILRDNIIKNLL